MDVGNGGGGGISDEMEDTLSNDGGGGGGAGGITAISRFTSTVLRSLEATDSTLVSGADSCLTSGCVTVWTTVIGATFGIVSKSAKIACMFCITQYEICISKSTFYLIFTSQRIPKCA